MNNQNNSNPTTPSQQVKILYAGKNYCVACKIDADEKPIEDILYVTELKVSQAGVKTPSKVLRAEVVHSELDGDRAEEVCTKMVDFLEAATVQPIRNHDRAKAAIANLFPKKEAP